MKIAYITYWSIDEGLSQGTSIPNLMELEKFNQVTKIDYYTFEKKKNKHAFNSDKINHVILKRKSSSKLAHKIADYYFALKLIILNHKNQKYDLIISRSSFAGIFGVIFFIFYRVPFAVESFEPHSDYELNIPNGWRKFGIRYIFLKFFENIQKKYAFVLLPVSNFYKLKLLEEGVPESKVIVQPCCINYNKVAFNEITRLKIRKELNIPVEHYVGVYAGKFGGLYYENDAFKFIGELYRKFERKMSIILLTPMSEETIRNELIYFGLDSSCIHIKYVDPKEVFNYLMAADFAFNFHISNSVSNFFSPIKNAEYWSIGLPIIISRNIGDDSELIEKHNIGIVIDILNEIEYYKVEKLKEIIDIQFVRHLIAQKTIQYRSIHLVNRSYQEMFNKLRNN